MLNLKGDSLDEIIGSCEENEDGDDIALVWRDLNGNLINLGNFVIPTCSKYKKQLFNSK